MKTKPQLQDGLKAKVLECIKLYNTPELRATRENISAYCGYTSDRQVRLAIEELRSDGEPIISDSSRAGYYYSPEDVSIIQAEMRARAYKLLETARAMDRKETMQMELAI